MGLLTDELRARIGETAVYTAPEELGRASIRYFALAIGDYNPLYVDKNEAARAGYRDVIAPPTLIAETNQYMIGPRHADGYMGHGWGIEIPDTRLVRGGNEYEFFQPVHPDDVVTATVQAIDWPDGAYNVVDDEPAPATTWLPVFAAGLGAPAPAAAQLPEATRPGRGASNAKARAAGWEPVHPTWREGFPHDLHG